MPSVLDAFYITLGLDDKTFQTGVKGAAKSERELENIQKRRADAEKRRAKEQDQSMRKQSDGFRRLRNDAIALAAVFTAGVGIKDFITNTINSAVNLGYLSQNLGQSTERLKAWQLASERAGGSQEGIIAQLKESVDSIAALNSGLGPNEGMQWFFRMGGSSKDLKDGNTYLLARSKLISDIFKVDPTKAALIAKQMGISEDQFNFIKLGPDAIEDLIKAQERHAAVSAKDAAASLKLKNQFLDLRNSLESTAMRIILQLTPAIERLFAKLEKGARWIADHKDDIAKWVDDAITAITDLIKWVDSAAESLGGWKNVLIALIGLKLGGFVLSLAGVAAQLVAIAGAAPAAGAALALLGKGGAIGAAAIGGYVGGSYLNKFIPEHARDSLGRAINDIAAMLGFEDAKYVKGLSEKQDAEILSGKKGVQPAILPKPQAAKAAANVPSNAQGLLTEMEVTYGLPLGLLDKIWATESGRGRNMLSSAGAEGHFQFMPRTAKEYGLKDPYDFEQSADAAARKMRDLLKQYGGDLQMATAAYNFGQGNLARTGLAGVPKETRDYVAKVAGGAQMAAAPQASGGSTTHTTTSEVNIQNLNVNAPQAKDAEGVAKGMKPALEKYNFANSANTGVIQ